MKSFKIFFNLFYIKIEKRNLNSKLKRILEFPDKFKQI